MWVCKHGLKWGQSVKNCHAVSTMSGSYGGSRPPADFPAWSYLELWLSKVRALGQLPWCLHFSFPPGNSKEDHLLGEKLHIRAPLIPLNRIILIFPDEDFIKQAAMSPSPKDVTVCSAASHEEGTLDLPGISNPYWRHLHLIPIIVLVAFFFSCVASLLTPLLIYLSIFVCLEHCNTFSGPDIMLRINILIDLTELSNLWTHAFISIFSKKKIWNTGKLIIQDLKIRK